MKIIFSAHSLLKLKQRNISKLQVIQTVKKPDKILLSLSNRKLAYKRFGKLYLKVVFVRENDKLTVITQHYEEKKLNGHNTL